jgi:hypothetical protein
MGWENFSRLIRGHYLEKRWDIMLLPESGWEYLKTGIPPTLKGVGTRNLPSSL